MSEFLRFVLLGLGIGALYALTAQGLVLIYRGSGVVEPRAGRLRDARRVPLLRVDRLTRLADRGRLAPRARDPRRTRCAHPSRGDATASAGFRARAAGVDVGPVLLPDCDRLPDLGLPIRSRPVATAEHRLPAVRQGQRDHRRPAVDHPHRHRHHLCAVGHLPLDPLRRSDRGGGPASVGSKLARPLARSHRSHQLGARRRTRRARRCAHRPDPLPQRRCAQLHGAPRAGRHARRPVPLVLAHARRRVRHRHRRVTAGQLHRPPGRVQALHQQRRAPLRPVHRSVGVAVGGVPDHRHRAVSGRHGPAAPLRALGPPTDAGPGHSPLAGCPRGRRGRRRRGADGARRLGDRFLHQHGHRDRVPLGRGRHRLRRPALAGTVRPCRLRGVGGWPARGVAWPAVPPRGGHRGRGSGPGRVARCDTCAAHEGCPAGGPDPRPVGDGVRTGLQQRLARRRLPRHPRRPAHGLRLLDRPDQPSRQICRGGAARTDRCRRC